jgi:outer membrane receptor protein involved in Fe transport
MSNETNVRLSRAIRIALGAGLAVAMSFSPVAAAEEESAELDRVQVTGTRLTQLQVEGASPVTVISREDLNRVPYDSVGQLLQSLPSMSGSPVNTYTNNGGIGATQVDLRGLGADRTLVLVNGRRASSNGDLNTIPVAMVDRIEVLKEGASAIYGADAVAGVINIITRSDFEGMELTAQYNTWSQTNAPTMRFSGVTGGNNDRSNFVVGFDYVDQDAAFQSELDTPWMQRPLTVIDAAGFRQNGVVTDGPSLNAFELGSSSVPGGNFLTSGGNMTLDYTQNADGNRTYHYDEATRTGTYRSYVGSGAVNDSYNFNPDNYIQTPNKRIAFFLQGSYDISSNLRGFMEADFQRRESEQFLAPLPYFSDFGDPGFAYTVAVPIDTDGDGVDDSFEDEVRSGVSAANIYNPFGENVQVRRRVVEFGGRRFFQTRDAYRAVLGVDGVIADRFNYEVSYNYSETHRGDTDYGQFYGPNMGLALGPSFEDADGNIVCGTPGNVVAGCVPLNLFGGPGTITQEMIDYVSVALNDISNSRTDVIHASIGGDLFELPAGYIQGAFGVERRREKSEFVPDSSKYFNVVTGNTGGPIGGSKEVDSYFMEFGIPVLSGVVAAESLELNVGIRRDSFDSFGSATSGQIGIRWQPVQDVLVRATKSQSFREPTIVDLFSAQADSFPSVSDPCGSTSFGTLSTEEQNRCIASGVPAGGWNDDGIIQLRSRIGGNPDLDPEDGESFTFGIGWAPDALPGFSIILDYWDFEVEDAISNVTAATVLNQCIRSGTASFCDDINRGPTGRPDTILTLTDNLGTLTARGVDLELNYAHGTGFGDFTHRLLLSRLTERTQQEFPGAEVNELAGFFDNTIVGDSSFPEMRAIYTADWSLGNWGASARIEHVGSMVDDNDHPLGLWLKGEEPLPVESVMYLDLTGRYYFATGTSVDIGITNVTDEEPPFINSGFNTNIDESVHRPMGTGYFVRLTQSF